MASKSSKRARVDAPTAPAADDVGSASASAATATSASPLQAVPTSSSSSSSLAVAGTTTKQRAPSEGARPGGLPRRCPRLCLPRRRQDKSRELDGGVGAAAVHNDDDEMDATARRSCIEQLRREKDYAVRQVRDEEQARSTLALKDLTARLATEHQRQLEEAREAQRVRHEAELTKVARQHEIAVRRLKDDLERCQNQLREEVEKRGVSSSVRAGFDAERARLIQKVADLAGAKRRLEDALQSAADAEKQKALELRRTQEACKQELARVSKDANAEIRKLLEELKAKDHQLALLDRTQYPDRGASLGKHHSTEVVQQQTKDEQAGVDVRQGPAVKQSTRPPPPAQPPPPSSSATSADRHLEETIRCLKADLEQLTGQLAASETDRALLKSQIDELRELLTDRDKTITDLRSADQGKEKSTAVVVVSSQEPKQGILTTKCQPKAVRFLLPGSTLPVLARELPTCAADEDETDSISSEVSDISSLSPTASPIMSPDSTIFCDESVEKNYHLLLTEHLQLQRSVALILSSWTSSSASSGVALDKQVTCNKDCSLKMESLKVAIDTLKDKISMCEEVEYSLRQQLKEQLEQNEELEFRLFELEECVEKCHTNHHDMVPAQDDSVIEPLKKKLALYEALEIELALPSSDDLPLRNFIVTLRQQRNDLENQLNICKSVMETLQEQQLRCHCKHSNALLPPSSQPLPLEIVIDNVVEGATVIRNERPKMLSDTRGLLSIAETETEDIVSANPSASSYWRVEPSLTAASDTQDFLNIEEEDDDKLCSVMMCSISSATSGFDDNSCASSVADDMRLDDEEIPAEEVMNWGVDVVDELKNDMVEITPCNAAGGGIASAENSNISSSSSMKTSEDGDELETATGRLSPASENSFTTTTSQDDDIVSRTDEPWTRRLEKLERRLMQALEGEQRARDQLALIGEEKDRRIMALEDQVDLLEANEFRLSKTIDTLEQLERTFRYHFLNSTTIASDCIAALMKSEDDTKWPAVAAGVKQQQIPCIFVAENVSEKSSYLDRIMSLAKEDGKNEDCLKDSDIAADDIGHPCNVEGCAQCHACRTLKNTIDQLQIAQKEHAAFDRRIRVLECPETVLPEDFDTHSLTTPQVVDFEAEYRELEVLVRELKKVLVVERQEEAISDPSSRRNNHSEGSSSSCAQASGRGSTMSSLSVESQNFWQFEDDSFSLPASPILELDNASLLVLTERNRELEITEQYLQQQICDLETERRQLHEVIHNNETTIHDLDVQLLELQKSEDSLKQDISRLRTKDDWMNRRIDDLMELVGRLEDTVKCHQTTESELRSRLERHQATETDLGRELENSMEETRATESKYRRWISQLEDEKDALLSRLDDLLDRNMELESREAALACRLRKMEVVELGLRGEIDELEHTLAHRMGEICEEKLVTIDGDHFSSAEGPEKSCRCHHSEHRAETCRLKETVTFLQQSLQASRRSNMGLETKLKEQIDGEQLLRGMIDEYEKIDQIWQERVSTLENSNKELAEKVSQLELQLDDVQQRCSVDMLTSSLDQKESSLTTSDDEALRRWTSGSREAETVSNTQGKRTVEQSIEAIIKGILLLNDAADHADHAELTYWAAVEGVANDAGNDAVTADDDVVTSPYWADVEAHMGHSESRKDYTITETTTTATTTTKSDLASSVAVRSTQSTADEVDTACVSSNFSTTMAVPPTTLPPPLPLSPPPPDSESHISSSLLSLDDYHIATGSESVSEDSCHQQSVIQGLGTQYHASTAVIDSLQKVSRSDVNATAPAVSRKLTVVQHAAGNVQQTPLSQQDTATSAEGFAARESLKERSNKARQFWTEMSDNQGLNNTTATTVHKVPPPVPDRPSSFRPSLIPRSAFVKQWSASSSSGEDKGNMSPVSPAIATMPVIKPANMTLGVAVERSAVDQSGRVDKRARSPVYTTVLTSNRSYIPKLVSGNGGGVSPNADEKPCSLTATQDDSSLPNDQSSEPTASKSSYPFVLFTSSSKLRSADSSDSTSEHQQHAATAAAAGSMTCNNPEPSPSSGAVTASPGRRD